MPKIMITVPKSCAVCIEMKDDEGDLLLRWNLSSKAPIGEISSSDLLRDIIRLAEANEPYGHQLKRLREERGLSQQRLADALGVSIRTIFLCEKHNTCSKKLAAKLKLTGF